jgi:hypothetical protein
MITFEQFYLTEAKYFPSRPTMHGPDDYTIYLQNANSYTIEMPDDFVGPNRVIGYIRPHPTPAQYKEPITNLRNIQAALGVSERDIPKSPNSNQLTSSKIYAFHIAKHKLEMPGPRDGNYDDVLFFRRTVNSTAELLKNYIEKMGKKGYTVMHPYSTNDFNAEVLKVAGVNNYNVANKLTFREAAQEKWNTIQNILNSVNKSLKEGRFYKEVYASICVAALSFLSNGLINNHPLLADLQGNNNFVSVEKLARVLNQLHNNHHDLLREHAEDLLRVVDINNNIEANKHLNRYLKIEANNARLQKGWLQGQLKSVYYKDLDYNINEYVAVVDDNINSKLTYDVVADKIYAKAKAQNMQIKSIQWFVGIVPIM